MYEARAFLPSPFYATQRKCPGFSLPVKASKKTNGRQRGDQSYSSSTAPRLQQESDPTETQQRHESRCGSGIACGKRGRRKDERFS